MVSDLADGSIDPWPFQGDFQVQVLHPRGSGTAFLRRYLASRNYGMVRFTPQGLGPFPLCLEISAQNVLP